MRGFWNQFKTPIVTIVIFFSALALYTLLLGPISFRVNNVNTNQTDIFSSSGEGEATAVPDEVTVYLGVTQSAQTVEEAQNQVNSAANEIINELKDLGIAEEDIKTTNYSVNPNVEVQPLLPRPTNQNGYTVTQNLEVKIKEAERANEVVDAATALGANLVGGVTFTFSDELQERLEKDALKQAVEDAKKKAQNLANISGIRLGKIINVVSSSNDQPFLSLGAEQRTDQPDTSTNITPGENTVRVGVTLYYETY
jgi:uncharacterized protein